MLHHDRWRISHTAMHQHRSAVMFVISGVISETTDQLVRYITVVLPGQFITDGTLHQTRQGRQHIDGWVDLPVVQLTVDEDLSLGDVASQVGNWMCDICEITRSGKFQYERNSTRCYTIVGHREDRNLCDRSIAALYTTCAFVYGRQISVHVTRVSTTTRDFFTSSRHLFCTSNQPWDAR